MPNLDRFRKDMQALAQIGRVAEGGVSRFSLSPADIEGRKLTIEIMESLGLSVRVDAIGNIRARREGRDPSAPIVMMGSHIDSVPNGGDYDGPTGVMGPLEIVRTLNDEGVDTLHPIEVVVLHRRGGRPVPQRHPWQRSDVGSDPVGRGEGHQGRRRRHPN